MIIRHGTAHSAFQSDLFIRPFHVSPASFSAPSTLLAVSTLAAQESRAIFSRPTFQLEYGGADTRLEKKKCLITTEAARPRRASQQARSNMLVSPLLLLTHAMLDDTWASALAHASSLLAYKRAATARTP